jgi:hypothetical protein
VGSKRNAALLLVVFLAAAGTFLGVRWYRSRPMGLAAQLKRLPQRDAVIVYVDFSRLRRAGILQLIDSSKTPEDADYREFAGKIDLDWRRDLDSVLLALAPSGKYMLVQGKFDWKRLRAYALGAGGECYGSVCRVRGSTPERRISFLPLRDNLMALAVSTDEWAVRTLQGEAPGPDAELPDSPLWLKVPGTALKTTDNLPDGTRMFARSIGQADFAMLMLAPEGEKVSARLDVHCNDAKDAADIAGQLSRATGLLREMIGQEHQAPNPADLSGVLAAGNFWSQGTRVYGRWPIERAFLENLFGGA